MKKYIAYVSGTIDVIVEAENAEQAEARIEQFCDGTSEAADIGISDQHAYLLGNVSNWCVDLVDEAPEDMRN